LSVYLFVERDSVLHRLDPRPKFLAVVAVIFLAVSSEHPLLPAVLQAGAFLGIWVAGAWSSLRRVRTVLIAIFLVSLVVWTFVSEGTTTLVGPIELESVLFGLSTGLKLSATITASVVWLSTTRNEEITSGFIRMGVPYRVAFAFSSALRMVPTFVGAGTTIIQAQQSRGLDPESGNVLTRIRKYLPLVVPVFAAALRSAGQMAMALEARGFGAQKERTSLLQLRMSAVDVVVTTLAVAGMIAGVVIAVGGHGRLPGLRG
jgi:energy-coupling factor transport system permease protein